MRKKKFHLHRIWKIILPGLLILTLLTWTAFSQRLLIRQYEVVTDKLEVPLRLAIIADLHETLFGEGQSELLAAIRKSSPDAVCLVGDILDGYEDEAPAWMLVEQLAAEYPCYYVTGNHEFWSGRASDYIQRMSALGVAVLQGTGQVLTVDGASIDIFGVDDPDGLNDADWKAQLDRCAATNERFSVLLSHRPERVADYVGRNFDLILCGHAHGGQVRIPFLLNGLYAPNQGFFPRYAGGRYDLEEESGQTMIVSRGLQRNALPRIFNRPELVIINLMPTV